MMLCSLCGRRIWRSEDKGPYVDSWFTTWHINCNTSIDARRAEAEAMKRPKGQPAAAVPARRRGGPTAGEGKP